MFLFENEGQYSKVLPTIHPLFQHLRKEAGGFPMFPPCLESQFDPTFVYLLSFFCLVLLLFLSYPFLLLVHSPDLFFPKPPFTES